MTPRRRKWILVLLAILLPSAAAFGVLHFFLVNHFTSAIQKRVVPEARQRLGVDVAVGNASVNLLAGTLTAADIRIGNPPGFQEPASFSLARMKLDVGWSGLLSPIVRISEARLDNAEAFLVRARNGGINLIAMRDAWDRQAAATGSRPPTQPPSVPETPGPTTLETPRTRVPLPPLLIEQASIRTRLAYVDYGLSEDVFRLTLALELEADDVATYERTDHDWGTLRIAGHLAENPKSFVINLHGGIGPFTDPEKPNFDLTGDVADIDLSRMEDVARNLGITSESVALNVNIQCRNGVFDNQSSRVTVRFKKARPVGKLARKLKHMPIQADLSVVVPVGGTIRNLEFHWEDALLQSALENAASILDSIPEDNTLLDKNTTRALKELGGLLK